MGAPAIFAGAPISLKRGKREGTLPISRCLCDPLGSHGRHQSWHVHFHRRSSDGLRRRECLSDARVRAHHPVDALRPAVSVCRGHPFFALGRDVHEGKAPRRHLLFQRVSGTPGQPVRREGDRDKSAGSAAYGNVRTLRFLRPRDRRRQAVGEHTGQRPDCACPSRAARRSGFDAYRPQPPVSAALGKALHRGQLGSALQREDRDDLRREERTGDHAGAHACRCCVLRNIR